MEQQKITLKQALMILVWVIFGRFRIVRPYSTKTHTKIWQTRKIDWNKEYMSTIDHPHRGLITWALKDSPFQSLWEVGVGPGANIARIVKDITIPTKRTIMLGGSDVNADAIELAKNSFKGGLFYVERGDEMIMSDKSVDIILTDMTLIYVGPWKIRKYLKEFKRIARLQIIFVEFDSNKFWVRLKERVTGYHAHNYRKLLEKEGYSFIQVQKIPEKYYPGEEPRPRALITAKP